MDILFSFFDNIEYATYFVFFVLLFFSLISLKKSTSHTEILSPEHSAELKWFSILAIITIHVSLSLVNDWHYLYPLWTLSGVGVDIFLFLSWYGLTKSMLAKPLSSRAFYKKRLLRVIVPFWIILTFLLLADWLFLGRIYDFRTIIESFLVYFPTADIERDINSPFWYLSLLIFFYLLFPLLFRKKSTGITALWLLTFGMIFIIWNPANMQTNWLHALHVVAFPLGVFLAGEAKYQKKWNYLLHFLREKDITKMGSLFLFGILTFIGYLIWKINASEIVKSVPGIWQFHQAEWLIEQLKSIILVLLFIIFFTFKPLISQFLSILGLFSYEIYLIHWPLISRYDIFFTSLPLWIATILWIFLLIILAWCINTGIKKLFSLNLLKKIES